MPHRVRIASSGREFTVEPGETVLAAALRQGIVLPYSCRDGACGTCKARILSGAVDYGDYQPKAMSEAERESGYALLCQAVPLEDLEIEAREIAAAGDIPIKILPCRVARMERAADDVMILHLKLPKTQRLQFLAGQYVEILLAEGRRRSFSLANAPGDDEFLQLHVRHVPGGLFSDHVFRQMREKELLRIQGPFGAFFLRDEARRPAILVAGGTGFAPIKSMVEDAAATGDPRPMHLYWGARAQRDLYMHDLAQMWARRIAGFRYTPVLSEPRRGDGWGGRTGFVHEAVFADVPDLSMCELYASGPPPMIEALRDQVPAHGLDPGRLFYDSFEYARDL
jgi:CDP-4-dehydro-6-deoxyglucose reductase